MSDSRDVDEPETGLGTGDVSASRPESAPWYARLKLRPRLQRARAERDGARRALEIARLQRDAARQALTEARAERDAARAELDRVRGKRYDRLQASLDAVLAESRATHSLGKTTDRRLRYLHRELITDIQALEQLLGKYSPQARLPAVAGWALSPAGLLALVDLIETRDASVIVECGSGTSSLWIAYALKHLGRGRLIALEHLPEYAEKTRALVSAHGVSDFVEVRLAPLTQVQTPKGEFSWYSFDPAELQQPIDVLLVDGPPGTTGPHARYPALPVLMEHLAPDAVIVADDVDRRDEMEIIEFWLEDEPRLRRADSPGRGIEVLEFVVG